ncbi:MAG: hypothetical protein V4675_12800 [Verrucomicrobiota bacterium]
MKASIEYEVPGRDNAIEVPFDNGEAGKYEFQIYPHDADTGDAVVLSVDREACRSLAKIFGQLSSGTYKDGYHIHLGWDETDTQAPVGLRIVLSDTGRINNDRTQQNAAGQPATRLESK